MSSDYWGVLETRNIGLVVFAGDEFDTWYGNLAYFSRGDHTALGFVLAKSGLSRTRPPPGDHPWLDRLFVCHHCFLYTSDADLMASHLPNCDYKAAYDASGQRPLVGRLVYYDEPRGYMIRQVRGTVLPFFCQKLALFGKLFLDDKLVFYDLEHYDFYVLYGRREAEPQSNGLNGHCQGHEEIEGNKSQENQESHEGHEDDKDQKDHDIHGRYSHGDETHDNYKHENGNHPTIDAATEWVPMGFFSKELLSLENNNNLACICVFPPFQRRGLGWLMIEFSYAAARKTPGQWHLGPEFPLSPYGQASYMKFWLLKLAHYFTAMKGSKFVLETVADDTGFRKEDIVYALEHMGLLVRDEGSDALAFYRGNLQRWCDTHHIDPSHDRTLLNPDLVLL